MLKKILTLIYILLLSFSSCHFDSSLFSNRTSNPFLTEIQLSNALSFSEEEKPLKVLASSDWHLGRDDRRDGITYYNDEFVAYLKHVSEDEGPYPFMLFLGDLTDYDYKDPEAKYYVNEVLPEYINSNFIYTIGNHEKRFASQEKWRSYWNIDTMEKYVFEDISIYKTDNSERVFGKKQLLWLEEALKKDTNPYKIILAHENVTSGGSLDSTTVVLGLADIAERNEIYRLCSEYNVSLLLTGHHHKGNINYSHSEYFGELNLAAMHRRDTLINNESIGYFYEISIYRGEEMDGEKAYGALIEARQMKEPETIDYSWFYKFREPN